jgi:hypothetical protein
MALIYLSGRRDPLEVSNDKAKSIKTRWIGDNVPKASSEDVVDLGVVTFSYGQIKQIELTPERSANDEENYNRQLTPAEKARRAETMKRIRADLERMGVIEPKKSVSDEPGFTKIGDFIK